MHIPIIMNKTLEFSCTTSYGLGLGLGLIVSVLAVVFW